MTTRTIQTGDRTITITDDSDSGAAAHPFAGVPDHPSPHADRVDASSFLSGMLLAVLIVMCFAAWRRARWAGARSPATRVGSDRMAAEVAALARRTAALETIITDPGQRTAREIDALR